MVRKTRERRLPGQGPDPNEKTKEQLVAELEVLHAHVSRLKEEAIACSRERAAAVEALRASEARFRRLVESNMIGVIFGDYDGTISEANDAFLQLIGYTKEELSSGGLRLNDLTPPEYRSRDERARQELRASGTMTPYEKAYIRKDGSQVPVLIGAAQLGESKDGWVAFVVDLSESKRAEQELRRSEARKGAFLEAALDAIITIDQEGRAIEFNPAAERMFGYRRDEVMGQEIAELIVPPSLRERHRDALARCRATGDGSLLGRRVEMTARRSDGTEFPVELTITRIPLDGPPLFTGFVRDITERKRTEAELRRLAAIIESSSDAIVGMTLDGIITSWNSGAERLYGYTAAEMVGQPISIVVPPDHEDELWSDLERLKRGEPVEDLETVRLRKDGSLIDVSVRISPIRDGTDHLLGASSIARDITERKRAEEEIHTLNAELEQRVIARTKDLALANQELEAFSYSVSHDLRAPVRSIAGFSQILLEDYTDKLDAQGQDYLRRMGAASQRMGQLIDALLDLARVTRSEVRWEPVNLSALAQTIAAELQKTQRDRRAEFDIAEGLLAQGDARLLRVALENLLGNAWKFTQNQPQARIEFGRTQEGDTSVYFLRDNGAGFDMAYAGKLFGPFQRLHRASEFEGTGIGLATVQRIIHRHGGRIWAEGAVGQGATFYFTLND